MPVGEAGPPLYLKQENEMGIQFTQREIHALEKEPDALRVLAEWHACQSVMAEPMGYTEAVAHHDARHDELEKHAQVILNNE